MKRLGMLLLVLAVAVLCTDAAWAQRGGRGRGGGRGPGGGPGMFGRGPGMFFGGGGVLGLLRIPEVQKELELVDDQLQDIQKLQEELASQRGERPRVDFQNMSEEERRKFVEERQKEAAEREKATKAKVAEILLPMQMERLEQIRIQTQGIRALFDPEVVAKLNITEEQREKMRAVMEESQESMRERMRELFQRGQQQQQDREAMREQFTKIREELDNKVLAVLTADQKKKFEELKGEPFDMPRPQFNRPGGRGPGGGGPGGNRGGDRPQRPAST